jgi:protein-tyrosine-phosphatase
VAEALYLLFVCTGNICRSPMAEGTARARIGSRYPRRAGELAVGSAGVAGLDGEAATTEAVITMRERGVDITGHRGRSMTPHLLASSDLVLTMEARQAGTVRAMSPAPLPEWPEPNGRPSSAVVMPLLRLGEAARRATRRGDETKPPLDLRERLGELARAAAAIQREGSWEFGDFAYEIGDPMGMPISEYSRAADAMERPVHHILDFLLS